MSLQRLRLILKTGTGRGNSRYISPAEKSISKSKTYWRGIIAGIISTRTRASEADSADAALLRAYGYTIVSSTEMNYTIQSQTDANANQDQAAEHAAIVIHLPKDEMVHFLRRQFNQPDRDFKSIMTQLAASMEMTPIPSLEGLDVPSYAALMKTSRLSDKLKQQVMSLNVPWNNAWSNSDPLVDGNLYTNYRVPSNLYYATQHQLDARPPNPPQQRDQQDDDDLALGPDN